MIGTHGAGRQVALRPNPRPFPSVRNRVWQRETRKNKAIKATKMRILDFGPYMFGGVDQQIGWFQSKGLLATSKTCPACSQPTDMQTRSDVTDEYRWRCSNTACRKVPGRVHLAGTSWKHCLHSSGKSVSGHCAQVPRLKNVGFRVVPSAGPRLRQFLLCALYRFL